MERQDMFLSIYCSVSCVSQLFRLRLMATLPRCMKFADLYAPHHSHSLFRWGAIDAPSNPFSVRGEWAGRKLWIILLAKQQAGTIPWNSLSHVFLTDMPSPLPDFDHLKLFHAKHNANQWTRDWPLLFVSSVWGGHQMQWDPMDPSGYADVVLLTIWKDQRSASGLLAHQPSEMVLWKGCFHKHAWLQHLFLLYLKDFCCLSDS